MNVRELMQVLEGLDGDMLVVLSSDAEGNGLSPLSGAHPDSVAKISDWEYEFDSYENIEALVLWPLN